VNADRLGLTADVQVRQQSGPAGRRRRASSRRDVSRARAQLRRPRLCGVMGASRASGGPPVARRNDPRGSSFGPLVIVGGGGVEAEQRGDRVVLEAPVSISAAHRVLESVPSAPPLFHNYCGRPGPPDRPRRRADPTRWDARGHRPRDPAPRQNPVLVDVQRCAVVNSLIGVAAPRSPALPARDLGGRPSPHELLRPGLRDDG
jgi:hypothetical protein